MTVGANRPLARKEGTQGFGRTSKDYAGGVQSNVKRFWNRYESKTVRADAIPIPLPIPGLWHIYPHGAHVPSQSQDPNDDQFDLNWDGHQPSTSDPGSAVNHINIITDVKQSFLNLITKNGGPA
jgi:hypothetical protein